MFRRLAVDEAPFDVELGRVEHQLTPVGERVVVGVVDGQVDDDLAAEHRGCEVGLEGDVVARRSGMTWQAERVEEAGRVGHGVDRTGEVAHAGSAGSIEWSDRTFDRALDHGVRHRRTGNRSASGDNR